MIHLQNHKVLAMLIQVLYMSSTSLMDNIKMIAKIVPHFLTSLTVVTAADILFLIFLGYKLTLEKYIFPPKKSHKVLSGDLGRQECWALSQGPIRNIQCWDSVSLRNCHILLFQCSGISSYWNRQSQRQLWCDMLQYLAIFLICFCVIYSLIHFPDLHAGQNDLL